MTRRWKAALWLGGIAGALLVGLYLALSFVVLSQVNRKLAHLQGYEGHVEFLSLEPLRDEANLRGLTLIVRGSKARVPLVSVEDIDVHYSWKALMQGGIVGEAVLRGPVVHYILPPKGAPQAGPQPPPQAVTPAAKTSAGKGQRQGYVYLSRVDVKGGRIEIQDDEVKPGYVLFLKDLDGTARNIGGMPGLTKELATATAMGVVMDKGEVKADFAADVFAEKPTFQYALSMRGVDLPQLNDWLRHYLFIEAHDGSLDFDSEAKSVNGQVEGYVKPLIESLHAIEVRGGKDIGKQLKGEAEKWAAQTLHNPKTHAVGTQVPFSGKIDKPKAKVFPALVELVRNAFVKALTPGLRGIVDFKTFPGGKKG